jgi:hypothetical protein
MITIDHTTGTIRRKPVWACPHQPPCPDAGAADAEAARIRVARPEQGWSLLCNGIVTFDDTGELLPDGRAVAPHPAGVQARG